MAQPIIVDERVKRGRQRDQDVAAGLGVKIGELPPIGHQPVARIIIKPVCRQCADFEEIGIRMPIGIAHLSKRGRRAAGAAKNVIDPEGARSRVDQRDQRAQKLKDSIKPKLFTSACLDCCARFFQFDDAHQKFDGILDAIPAFTRQYAFQKIEAAVQPIPDKQRIQPTLFLANAADVFDVFRLHGRYNTAHPVPNEAAKDRITWAATLAAARHAHDQRSCHKIAQGQHICGRQPYQRPIQRIASLPEFHDAFLRLERPPLAVDAAFGVGLRGFMRLRFRCVALLTVRQSPAEIMAAMRFGRFPSKPPLVDELVTGIRYRGARFASRNVKGASKPISHRRNSRNRGRAIQA